MFNPDYTLYADVDDKKNISLYVAIEALDVDQVRSLIKNIDINEINQNDVINCFTVRYFPICEKYEIEKENHGDSWLQRILEILKILSAAGISFEQCVLDGIYEIIVVARKENRLNSNNNIDNLKSFLVCTKDNFDYGKIIKSLLHVNSETNGEHPEEIVWFFKILNESLNLTIGNEADFVRKLVQKEALNLGVHFAEYFNLTPTICLDVFSDLEKLHNEDLVTLLKYISKSYALLDAKRKRELDEKDAEITKLRPSKSSFLLNQNKTQAPTEPPENKSDSLSQTQEAPPIYETKKTMMR